MFEEDPATRAETEYRFQRLQQLIQELNEIDRPAFYPLLEPTEITMGNTTWQGCGVDPKRPGKDPVWQSDLGSVEHPNDTGHAFFPGGRTARPA